MLRLERVTKRFGELIAVNDLSLTVPAGSISAMIGPNGAGKSTVFNIVSGIYRPSAGEIVFEDERIDAWPSHRIAAGGVARTFQNIRLFSFMAAIDNVLAGEDAHLHARLWDSLLHTPRQRREEKAARERARELLRFVGLKGVAETYARNLPYGSQRRLEIARALASRPRMLLLDEPAAGMNPREKGELADLVAAVRERGITVLLIEHDMGLVMRVSDEITVLDHGERIARGTPAEIRNDPRVIAAYLGTAVA